MTIEFEVVQPSGILDGTKANQFNQEINDMVAQNAKMILIDFQAVTFMDSSGLGSLVKSLKTVRAAGGELFLCSINNEIKMLFELTSMDRVFEVFADRKDFENKLLNQS